MGFFERGDQAKVCQAVKRMPSMRTNSETSGWGNGERVSTGLPGTGWNWFTIQGVPALKFIQAFAESKNGDLWVADGSSGLVRIRGKSALLFDARNGLPKGSAMGVFADSQDQLWSLTSGLLSYFKDERFHQVRFRSGAGMADVGEMHEDAQNGFWFAGSGGIYHADRRELADFIEGRTAEVGLVQFNRSDGLSGTSGTKYSHPIMVTGDNDSVWISSSRGIAVADPRRTKFVEMAVPVSIEQVQSEDRTADANVPTQFSPGTRRLQFSYTGLNLTAPDKVVFRYRLSGLEDKWSEPTQMRSATYTNLAPGHYHFEVIAANGGGAWSGAVQSAEFEMMPHFYQTPWFFAAWIASLALAIWGIYLLRVRQIRGRFELVLNERTRIAREIHDTLLQGFAGVAWQLDSVSRQMLGHPRESQRILNMLLAQMDECLVESRQAISGMRVRTAGQLNWEQQIEGMGRQLAEDSGAEFVFNRNGPPYELTPLGCESIFFVAKEAIRNAFRHAGPRSVSVLVQYSANELVVTVTDDGRGFTALQEFAPGHWGIQGMRERMSLAAGELVIESSPTGTIVRATLPRAVADLRNGVQTKSTPMESLS